MTDKAGKIFAGVLVVAGILGLVDGYAGYAAGEESLVRWLLLPLCAFALAVLFGTGAMRREKEGEP